MLTKNVASTINKMIKQDASTKKAKAGGYLLHCNDINQTDSEDIKKY